MRYLPLTDADRSAMLAVIGAPDIDALFADVPAGLRLSGPIAGLPLHASDFTVAGTGRDQTVTFTTRTEDEATAGPDHPLLVPRDSETGEPAPSVLIRPGLAARIDRKSFYRLVDLGVHEPLDGQSWFGVWSQGVFFPMIPSNELP